MTTFHGRLLISSLPDLRGIWGLSYDEGSVISTVASASQLILAPILPFFLTALGLRRLLLPLSLGFVCVAFCIPFISGYENLLVAHALMGLLIGSFVTATIQIMLKHLPPPWWVVVLAFFTFRVSLGINSGVSLGAFYLEYMGWQWIYWQSGLIMFVYFVLLQRHLPPDTPIRELLHKPDYSGMAFYCLSAVLIYAGLDQGERLGWFDSGIITVFLAGGTVSFLLFLANEALVERPWAPPRLFADFNIIMSVGMVIIYIFILSANSLLITLFLDTVHDLRPLQSGLPLLLVALLQLLATPFCAFLVLKADTRLLCATGVLLMGLACYQGTFITADWVAADFFPMAILFAIGHPLVFLSLMAFCMACFTAKTAVGLLAYIQVSPWIILDMLLLVILFFLLNFNRLESGKRIQETDNAYTQLDRVVLEAKVNGYVAQVGFGDFQQVKAGDVLLRVQDADYRARTDQARAVRDKSAANLERLDLEIGLQEACIRQARVAAENAAARLDLASRENARVQKLFKCNAVSTREADSAEINLRTAQHSHREALAEVRVQERKLELQKADRQLREADLRAAEAQLQSALIDLGHTIITAPGNGHTGARKIQVGDLVREGMQVVSLVLDMPPYIVANYKETQIGNIRAGQPVEILIDTFPGHTFKGHVESISPATGATFSLLPKDTSSGNFTKVVQRIPVRIAFEPGQERLPEIRSGMSVITRIDTGSAQTGA